MRRGAARQARGRLAAAALVAFAAVPAHAQAPAPDPPPLGLVLDADFLGDLPTSDNLFVVFETLQPSLISDRSSGAGLYTGQPARVGGFLGSWNQAVTRVGRVDITDPAGGGVPLLFPDLNLWERVEIATGALPAAVNATGHAVTLEPRRPAATWTTSAQGAWSHGLSAQGPAAEAAPIARLDTWDRAAALASGPIVPGRLGAVFAASWTRGSQFFRAEPSAIDATARSGFAHLVFTAGRADQVRAIGWLDRSQYPFELRVPFGQPGAVTTDTGGHLQATWSHDAHSALPWQISTGYTRRRRAATRPQSSGPPAVFERLVDGPLSQVTSATAGLVRQWSVGAEAGPATARVGGTGHQLRLGIDLDEGATGAEEFFSGEVGESVDGLRARVWRFVDPGGQSRRSRLAVGLYAADRMEIGRRIAIDAGLRFDSLSGSAEEASTAVRWRTWLPRARVRVAALDDWRTTLVAGYSRLAYRLPLDVLAIGDPAAPTADVFRWDATEGHTGWPETPGPIVARVGPGTAGDPAFSGIDPGLRRPVADEIVLGVELRPRPQLRLSLMGLARRETDLLGLANLGVPASSYAIVQVEDPGADVGQSGDDRVLPVYNRLAASFGTDRYLLTNPGHDATFKGLELSAHWVSPRLELVFGATAGIAEGEASSRGFGPIENDHALIGERFTTPNAEVYARGRLFQDRAYTIKLAGVYRLADDLRLGVVARYQDGQPFARVVVVPGLGQGADFVRAFSNGESRFTFTATLDARLQKRFAALGGRLDAIADVYNLLNSSFDVEERAAAAPDDRTFTAVQPPRAFHLGLRVTF